MKQKITSPQIKQGIFRRIHKNIEDNWNIDRFAFWPAATILIVLTVAFMSGRIDDTQDFTAQAWVFGMLAASIGITGMTIGYKLPAAHRLWLSADIVWLFAPVLTLGAVLAGVESQSTGHRLERAQQQVIWAHRQLLATVYDATDSTCRNMNRIAPACAQWTDYQRSLAMPGMSMNDIGTLASLFSDIEQAERMSESGRSIAREQMKLFEALKQYNDLKTETSDISFFLPYAYIIFMSLALGFRAAAGGAQLANIQIQKNKKIGNESYFHAARQKLRLKKVETRRIKRRRSSRFI